jgi:hypothetical protein
MATARRPAAKWSLPTGAGEPAVDLFADSEALARLLASLPVPAGLRTRRTPSFLRWRYRLASLHYRALPFGDRVEDGFVIVRLRARGGAVEATVADVLVPSPDRAAVRAFLSHLPRALDADYAIMTAPVAPLRALPLPHQGPILTWREVGDATVPTLDDLDLSLGDIELF